MNDKPALKQGQKVKWEQGRFVPKHPQKYIGNPNGIIYRSSWEKKFSQWCDTTPSVVRWGSEEIVIPYQSPKDGRMHRYFVDYVVWTMTPDGLKKFLVEIKPSAECSMPKPPKRRSLYESYRRKLETFAVNREKWKYAREWCRQHGYGFLILTENELNKASANRRRRK